jgi:hypothetical protein
MTILHKSIDFIHNISYNEITTKGKVATKRKDKTLQANRVRHNKAKTLHHKIKTINN